jgi:hypothetical protein
VNFKSDLSKKIIYFDNFPVKIGLTTNAFGDFSFENHDEAKLNSDLASAIGVPYFAKLRCAVNTEIDTRVKVPIENRNSILDGESIACFAQNGNSRSILIGCTGDCPYVFLTDRKKGFIGLVHSGWRGTRINLAKIFIDTLELVGPDFFSPSDTIAFIWPGICKQCYEVGQEFKEYFPGFIVGNRLDLKIIIIRQLVASGIKYENIFWPKDTYCSAHTSIGNKYLFSSYRRGSGPGQAPNEAKKRNAVFIAF